MNGILVINKDLGYTSRDIVNIVCKELGTKKVGHTGTLDPNATGVLVLCVGNALKLCEMLTNHDKEYIAGITLGIETDTLDMDGTVIKDENVMIDKDMIIDAVNSFKGSYMQEVPKYSAVKVNGKKLYEYAREGIEIERKAREIEICELDLLSYDKDVELRCLCSSGTYIRSLCVDIAEKLGQKGILSSLVRTRIDQFTLDQTYTLEQIEKGEFSLLTNYQVLNKYTYIKYDKLDDVKNGKRIQLPCRDDMVMIVTDDEVIAAYQHVNNGLYEAKRGLW